MTRGALPEAQADDVNYLGTYVAGLYNRLVSDVAGRQVENEDLVNVPNWLPLQFRIAGGPWFDLQREQVEGYRSELDMRWHAYAPVQLARRRGPADPRGSATVRQPKGPAPGRSRDAVHGRELVR